MNLDVDELARWAGRLVPRNEPSDDDDGWPEGLGLPPDAGRPAPTEPPTGA